MWPRSNRSPAPIRSMKSSWSTRARCLARLAQTRRCFAKPGMVSARSMPRNPPPSKPVLRCPASHSMLGTGVVTIVRASVTNGLKCSSFPTSLCPARFARAAASNPKSSPSPGRENQSRICSPPASPTRCHCSPKSPPFMPDFKV